jgi:hypothetical protein
VADLLSAYGFHGTFFVPRRNVEGRPVLDTAQLRSLASGFEIGGHTLDHIRLDAVSPREAERQITEGKMRLEDELGREVLGFCYPGGAHDATIRALVKSAGFRYARTIVNFRTDRPTDVFQAGTTIQLYPHSRVTYLTNFVRGGGWSARRVMFRKAMTSGSLPDLLERALDVDGGEDAVLHLWGHSWELTDHSLWSVLEDFLRRAREVIGSDRRVDNATLYA